MKPTNGNSQPVAKISSIALVNDNAKVKSTSSAQADTTKENTNQDQHVQQAHHVQQVHQMHQIQAVEALGQQIAAIRDSYARELMTLRAEIDTMKSGNWMVSFQGFNQHSVVTSGAEEMRDRLVKALSLETGNNTEAKALPENHPPALTVTDGAISEVAAEEINGAVDQLTHEATSASAPAPASTAATEAPRQSLTAEALAYVPFSFHPSSRTDSSREHNLAQPPLVQSKSKASTVVANAYVPPHLRKKGAAARVEPPSVAATDVTTGGTTVHTDKAIPSIEDP